MTRGDHTGPLVTTKNVNIILSHKEVTGGLFNQKWPDGLGYDTRISEPS